MFASKIILGVLGVLLVAASVLPNIMDFVRGPGDVRNEILLTKEISSRQSDVDHERRLE